DVVYTVPAYASTLDVASVTDLDPEFTLSGGGIALDATQAPVLVAHDGASWTFRYWTTGGRDADVTLTFVGGSVSFRDAAGNAIPLLAPRTLQVVSTGD